MVRKIIKIDEDKCNGCGLCAAACHEGAIGMVDGKARLLHDAYCDGLGDCLPVCPTDAISFEEREAAAYDEQAVLQNKQAKSPCGGGCPGARAHAIDRKDTPCAAPAPEATEAMQDGGGMLRQWPVQIKLVPAAAPYFDGANLLIAADCAAYAYGSFHRDFIANRITLIGCPKLDETDYSEKILAILKQNSIRSVTVVRMEVPCCGGLENAVKTALMQSGKLIPWHVVTLSADGRIVERC